MKSRTLIEALSEVLEKKPTMKLAWKLEKKQPYGDHKIFSIEKHLMQWWEDNRGNGEWVEVTILE